MDDDTNYVIVAEDQLSSRDLDWRSRGSFEGTSWSLQTQISQSCDKCLADTETNFITEAIVTDDKGSVFKLKGKCCGKAGHFVTHYLPYSCLKVKSAVVRAFAKKEDVLEDFNKHWAKDVTFLVKSVPIFGDRNYLAGISPVFDRMFNGKFAEANQQEIELGDIKPDSFNDFLMAIWRIPVMPNSSNVVELLELADRFDVASLGDNCEKHLKISSKMEPDLLILCQNYRLESLQDFLVKQITAEVWLQWQRSDNWLEKIGALNGITVSRITTKLELDGTLAHDILAQEKPNSANVVELLELADRFDVASLRDNCEKHLKISSKMEPIDLLILSQNYRLESLQDFLVNQITAEIWLQWQRSENWLEKLERLTSSLSVE
ncbi:BTB/POZ domain-containing protein [Ditylenchus destructor]|nr:BTB/POZ domain-containing protein [Ditylenchus destructor]